MTAHTPGPWDCQRHEGCKQVGPRTSRQTINSVATTDGLWDEAEDRANAHLIAAAPDLLEALMDVLGPLATVPMADTGHNTEQRPTQPNLRVSGAALHRARAAIAKAEGA